MCFKKGEIARFKKPAIGSQRSWRAENNYSNFNTEEYIHK